MIAQGARIEDIRCFVPRAWVEAEPRLADGFQTPFGLLRVEVDDDLSPDTDEIYIERVDEPWRRVRGE